MRISYYFVITVIFLLTCTKEEKVSIPTDKPTVIEESVYNQTASGLKYAVIQEGSGDTAGAGHSVTVHYSGWLTDGKRFDSSVLRQKPFTFELGAGNVIAGWEEGIAGMKEGGIRQLVIPPDLAYGERGAAGVIPPNATLVFEVQLLEVK